VGAAAAGSDSAPLPDRPRMLSGVTLPGRTRGCYQHARELGHGVGSSSGAGPWSRRDGGAGRAEEQGRGRRRWDLRRTDAGISRWRPPRRILPQTEGAPSESAAKRGRSPSDLGRSSRRRKGSGGDASGVVEL
jgi:hypothetical protein